MSAKEAAEKWGISQRRVDFLCSEGRIEQAQKIGSSWVIPVSAEKPADARSFGYAAKDGSKVKPFLKWAGGKGQLLAEISQFYPFASNQVTKYAEPFVGGGAVLFDVLDKFDLAGAYISDTNEQLINAYCVVRDSVEPLVKKLVEMQNAFLPASADERKAYYNAKRGRFNELKLAASKRDSVERAALLIFLNRTCFNGLYRENRKGMFNVPMGAYKNPVICDATNLRAASEKLQNVKIVCAGFKQSEIFIDAQTFAYFDPPYRPLPGTDSFTAYTKSGFADAQQIELAQFASVLDARGARVLVSNSDPKNVDPNDNFFDQIYSQFHIKRVKAARVINSKGDARGKISELLISNF
jgi:DNA adenine methylase